MNFLDKFFTALNDALVAAFAAIGDSFVALCERVFKPVLFPFFDPINTFLAKFYQPWATIIVISYFVGTMIWVCFLLRESYVNLGRPNKVWYSDLRIWTVGSMVPHVFVYFYFY